MSLDENYQQTVTITVKACTSQPAVPTGITFSKTTGIKLNEEITATAEPEVTSGGAVPAQYNWTIPSDYFDIIGDNDKRVISLKAKAASPEITDAIKVNAHNTCGTSADYSNTTQLSIYNCTDEPAPPGTISFSPSTVDLNGTFTASVPTVSDGTQIPTSYIWTIPAGLTPTGTQTTFVPTITLTGATAGTYVAGSIEVTAKNDCGTSDARNSDSGVTVNPPACPGGFIANGAYSGPDLSLLDGDGTTFAELTATYSFAPSGDLCLASQDLGSPTSMNFSTANDGCADLSTDGSDNWRLPNIAELGNLVGLELQHPLTMLLYWSTTKMANVPATYWSWNFETDGTKSSSIYNSRYVRCVRSL
jgi:hypothetical protein